jgi:hypothetical protein
MDVQIIQIVNDKYEDPHDARNEHIAHNGKHVSLISLSPSGTYAATYSEDDNSIEGWNVENSEHSKLIQDHSKTYKFLEESVYISTIKVNDDGIVCYTDSYGVEILSNKQIKKLNSEVRRPRINFTKNGDLKYLVIFDNEKISIYDADKQNLKSSHELSSYNEVITGVSIDDSGIWVISPNYLFHLDLKEFQLKFSYSLGFTVTKREIDNTFKVISKGNFIVVKNYDKIAIFLKGVHYPIRNIDLKDNDIKVGVQNNYLLAFNVLKQNIKLYHITDTNKQPIDASMIFNKDSKNDIKDKFFLYEYNSESEKAFGLTNGNFSCNDSSDWHKLFQTQEEENDFVSWNNYLCQASEKNYGNDTLAFPDMENIKSLISGKCDKKDMDFNKEYQWQIDVENKKLSVYYQWQIDVENKKLSVCSNKNKDKKTTIDLDNSWNMKWNWRILNNNALALRYCGNTVGDSIKIYEYDINNKKIEVKYYYKKGFVELNGEEFSGPMLPIMPIIGDIDNDNKDNLEKIIESIIKDSRCLAKYGSTLLPILIKSSDPTFTRLIEKVYDECMRLVKEDSRRNLKFLSIITLSMNDLYKKYSNYLTKFNSEMFMILDPFNEKIVNTEKHSHFFTYSQEIELVKITKYSKFLKFFQYFYQYLHLFLLDLRNSVADNKSTQCITLIVPYIDYSRYPLEYRWWKELFYPQSSIFVKTCKKEFYSNWNGEAVINFKWKTFGKAYYIIIWLLFIVFLGCFTIASYPNDSITKEIRIKLFKTSIAFGLFNLTFELRQLIFWKPKRYFLSIWNLFGKCILRINF